MNIELSTNPIIEASYQTNLTEMIDKMEEICQKCNPLSVVSCVTNCSVWKLKNELSELYRKAQSERFRRQLLNTLKNKRRLRILILISKSRYSIDKLQQDLRTLGYYHSRKTIIGEYLSPLIAIKSVKENQNKYCATIFGHMLAKLIKDFQNMGDLLPPHSECYEEEILVTLMSGPKNYKVIQDKVPIKSVGRILSRLQAAGLIEMPKEKDYVFFFKTQRDPDKERFSPTEKRVYSNISEEGISARKLAEKTSISLRRTYKYLRRLKGKKLVFTRKKLKNYVLTSKGFQMAYMLRRIEELTHEIQVAAIHLIKKEEKQKPVKLEAKQLVRRHQYSNQ